MKTSTRSSNAVRRFGGFTLIELLTTVAVTGVLLAVAVPSFVGMSERNRISSYTNDMLATIYFARSEAVRTGKSVSICPSSNGTSCTGAWKDGWVVFRDDDADGTVDSGELLKKYDALSGGYELGSDTDISDSITFRADGAATKTGVMALCHNSSVTGSRAIVITRLRPRIALDTDNNRVPNLDDGSNITSCSAPTSG